MAPKIELFAEYQGSFGANGRGVVFVMLTFEDVACMVKEDAIYKYGADYRCLLKDAKIETIFLPDTPYGTQDFLPRVEISPDHAKQLRDAKEFLRKKTG